MHTAIEMYVLNFSCSRNMKNAENMFNGPMRVGVVVRVSALQSVGPRGMKFACSAKLFARVLRG